MPQIFVTASRLRDGAFVISGDDYHHLVRVRRVRKNDIIKLRSQEGMLFTARVVDITGEELVAETVGEAPDGQTAGDRIRLELAACVLKGKKFDYVIQKSTEIGVDCIAPVVSERTVPDLSEKAAARCRRWEKIALEAAKQSMRDSVPDIREIISFDEYLAGARCGVKILAHPGAEITFSEFAAVADKDRNVSVLVGPEGGFSNAEIRRALSLGWSPVSFGFTSLRAETASLVIPSLIIFEWSRQ